MAPEIQLFMKAQDSRPKDDADFDVVSPLLDGRATTWLIESLRRHYPDNHWLDHPRWG
jgi:hypothetical protein